MRRALKKRGFSDRLYIINFCTTWIFVLICILLTIFSEPLGIMDLSIVSVGIPAVFTELGIHSAFMIWKAKTENCRKFKDVSSINLDGVEFKEGINELDN